MKSRNKREGAYSQYSDGKHHRVKKIGSINYHPLKWRNKKIRGLK